MQFAVRYSYVALKKMYDTYMPSVTNKKYIEFSAKSGGHEQARLLQGHAQSMVGQREVRSHE